jgi:ABC-type sugar transport system substrate-binding protein
MKVTLVAPNVANPDTFYEIFADFLHVAARQLGIEFEAVDGTKDLQIMLRRSREAATGTPGAKRPDYMLLVNYQGAGHDLLAANAAAGVGTFFVVEGMAGAEVGTGGGRRPTGYLGQIVPDDVEAGRMLAQILTDAARARGLGDANGKIQVGAIAGEHTQAGNARFRGLQSVAKEHPDIVQAGFQYGTWEEQPAKEAATLMLRSTPEIRVLWCANDAMALGALDAAVEAGRKPGKDILIGGIDLIDRALAEVAAGRIEVSIGGHLADGVRALILLHDHHESRDLVPRTLTTHLVAVRQAQADRYLRFTRERAWRHVDFTRFSRLRNPDASEAGLSLESILALRDKA